MKKAFDHSPASLARRLKNLQNQAQSLHVVTSFLHNNRSVTQEELPVASKVSIWPLSSAEGQAPRCE